MRTGDVAPPTVPAHTLPPGAPLARWPFQLVIALEYLLTGAYVWDDGDASVVWDRPDGQLVWDATFVGSGFTDVACDFHSLLIEPGEPDELGLFPPGQVTLTLDNRSGAYTVWTADGRLTYWAPGRRIAIWTVVDGEPWWLFAGRMTAWQTNTAEGTVTIEAFDGLAALAEEVGAEWTPGTAGQLPLDRIRAIAAATAYTDPIGGDLGDVALTTGPTDVAPLEACQTAALSDGGIFAADVDGRLIYRNRLWRTGRDDQAPVVPAFSDNVCDTSALVVWDPETAADDIGLFTAVELTNVAGTTVRAALPATSPNAWWTGRQWRLTHPDPDLWPSTAVGQALADYLLAETSTPAMAVRSFSVYLFAPQLTGRWLDVLDLRRGDRYEWISDYTAADGPARLDVFSIVVGVRHEITPESWQVTVAGTRTVDYVLPERWDETLFTWDDPAAANVWRF